MKSEDLRTFRTVELQTTQEKASRMFGVTHSTYCRWEKKSSVIPYYVHAIISNWRNQHELEESRAIMNNVFVSGLTSELKDRIIEILGYVPESLIE